MFLRVYIILLLSFGVVAPAWSASCTTSLNGSLHRIEYTATEGDESSTGQFVPKDEMRRNSSTRERLFGRWGKVDCPGYLTLREFTPGLSDDERRPFCLVYDKDADTYRGFSEGERNAYLICKDSKTFCERVNATKDEANYIARVGLEAARRSAVDSARSALTPDLGEIITHSSGALIMKGTGSFISSALGTTSASIGTALTAPAVLATGAVTLVGVGGAVYFCR